MSEVLESAIDALRGTKHRIADAIDYVPDASGLYAIYGDDGAPQQLGLDGQPSASALYVGKAEDSLVSRDLKTHFSTGKTGRSTVRRTFAALLRDRLDLKAVPRNLERPDGSAHYALEPGGDQRLTEWMYEHLTLAVWVKPEDVRLREVERAVLRAWQPPLNLTDVEQPWRLLKDARRAMAAEARSWNS